MNPLSLLLIGLGIIMVYIGWKGSQHSVLASLTGHASTAGAQPAGGSNTPGNATPTPSKASPGKATNAGSGNNAKPGG